MLKRVAWHFFLVNWSQSETLSAIKTPLVTAGYKVKIPKKAQSMKSIDQSMASAASIASFEENGSSSNQVQPQTQHLIQPQIQPPVQGNLLRGIDNKTVRRFIKSFNLSISSLFGNLSKTQEMSWF